MLFFSSYNILEINGHFIFQLRAIILILKHFKILKLLVQQHLEDLH